MTMIPAVFFGGIHDGLEFEVDEGARALIMPSLPTSKVPDLFKEDGFLTMPGSPVGEDRVTYSYTGEQTKDERWIFQII